jgi:hypothetical protein
MTFPDSSPEPGEAMPPDLEPVDEAPRPPRWRLPWRAALALGAIAAASALIVVLAAIALAASSSEYGYLPNDDARGWAVRPLGFASQARCVDCHPASAAAADSNGHALVSCQGCHGAGAEHAAARRPGLVDLALSTSDECVRCHTSALGRSEAVPQVTITRHYTAACIDCHNPHTAIALRPPTVPHPLTHLPACIVCHGPDGFRARDQRHPLEPTDDRACLECHAFGRGVIDVPEDRP